MSVMLYPCIVCVALLMNLFVNCLVKQFAMCLCVVAILLLNGMEVFSVHYKKCKIIYLKSRSFKDLTVK